MLEIGFYSGVFVAGVGDKERVGLGCLDGEAAIMIREYSVVEVSIREYSSVLDGLVSLGV